METPILHKAYLTRPLVERTRPGLELLTSDFACAPGPVVFIRFEHLGDQALADSPFAEFLGDAFGAESAVRPMACVYLGKATIAQYALRLELIERGLNYRFVESLHNEFFSQLEAAVLAASECSNS